MNERMRASKTGEREEGGVDEGSSGRGRGNGGGVGGGE